MSVATRPIRVRNACAVPFSGRRGCARPLFPARDRSRLAARGNGSEGDEGGLRRGGLRRLHRRSGAAQGRGARLRAFQRLHTALGPARRSGTDHDRGPCQGRRAASAAAGNGRSPRLAMRFLHARDRHEPVRRLSLRGASDIQRALRPACRQSLPMHRLSPDHRSRARDLQRRGQATGSRRRRGRERPRWPPSPTGRDLFVGDEAAFFAAPASLDSLAALYARFPDATLVAGRPTSGFGSPSSCAT